jgi:hypothetical protein
VKGLSDRLIVEIDVLDDRAEDAVFALLHLANEIAASPMVHIRDYEYEGYRLRWKWVEEGR